MTCAECKNYFAFGSDVSGQCRAHPPTPLWYDRLDKFVWEFPSVDAECRCGEFEPKPKAEEAEHGA